MTEEEPAAIEIVFSNEAATFLDEQIESLRVLKRIEKYIRALAAFPEMGQRYVPDYEAARPPMLCRWIAIPSTPFTIYYHFSETARRIVVLSIEHPRSDPQERF